MIAAWMLWSIGTGLMFLVAGLAAEKLLPRGRRWAWAAAGAGATTLPVVRFLQNGSGAESAALAGRPVSLEPLTVTVTGDSALHSLDDMLLLGWAVLSALLLIAALLAGARLLWLRRSWQAGSLLGREVLWSRDAGPAVVGLARPRIVLPAWVRGTTTERQELILAHEEEHVRAKDVQFRFLAILPLLAFPWNPVLWFQYRRLNLAVELDCDRRVIARMPGRRRLYGTLLLHVGSRRRGPSGLAFAALAEQRSFLERRIRDLLRKAPEVRLAQAAFLLFCALFVTGIAVIVPGITREGATPADDSGERIGAEAAESTEAAKIDVSAKPAFTPFTVAPAFANIAEVRQALEREYPPLLRDAGIGGTVQVWFFIDENGKVTKQSVNKSSGHTALDEAALRVAPVFTFTPALNRDKKVSVWVSLPITFTTR